MRGDILSDNRTKLCKCSEHYQTVKAKGKNNSNPLKPKSNSSWGSQLVKGFTTDKKSKQQVSIPNRKQPLACLEISSPKNQYVPYHSRVKRSLIGDFPSSANAAQVHPHVYDCQQIMSPASHDLFVELDHLRELLRDSKERESALKSELRECKVNPKVSELEKELDTKRSEIAHLISRVSSLEAEKLNLSEQLASVSSILEHCGENSRIEKCENFSHFTENQLFEQSGEGKASYGNLEIEVVELRRLNKELQLDKRDLTFRLSSAESQLATLMKVTESDVLAQVQAEASVLRHTNENLSKQVEGLQMSRLTEVEELAYLRWVNSCLRHELCNSDTVSRHTVDLDSDFRCKNTERNVESSIGHKNSPHCPSTRGPAEISNFKKVDPVRRLRKWPQNDEDCQSLANEAILDKDWIEALERKSPRRRHSISGPKGCVEDLTVNKRRQSDGFMCPKEIINEASAGENHLVVRDKPQFSVHKYDLGGVQSPRFSLGRAELCKVAALDVEKRALRIPNPPPRPSNFVSFVAKTNGSVPIPPPPPPPPPPKFSTRSTGVMQRAPQVAELYHSLMKRDSRKDSSVGGICDVPNVANVRSSMIGEIENRSSHLLAIKADVETQGEFVKSLIKEVNAAAFRDIEDVVAFVKWLDDELCFLVDERAVLKHFDWPEKKADTLREAAFGYRDLKKLEFEISNYEDDPRLPRDIALKKMVALSEKMERSVYNLFRTRDQMIRHCKEFHIPTDWTLDGGIISKIKFASVKLAKKYMKRVAIELQAMGASDKDPALEYMLLQGVRFAFRIHQFAGGFDAETMHAFEELRNLAHVRYKA